MTENYLEITDNYSLVDRKKISSTGSIPYDYSCLKDPSFVPIIPENIREILKRDTDYEMLGLRPRHTVQTIYTTFDDSGVLGYTVSNPISFDYLDCTQWKKLCDALGVPEYYDFHYELIRLTATPDPHNLIVAGLQGIRYNNDGKIMEFIVRNATFDLDIIKNNIHYENMKKEWSRLSAVEQLVGINPYNDDVSLETISLYSNSAIAFDNYGEKEYKLYHSPYQIEQQSELFLKFIHSFGVISESDVEYCKSVAPKNKLNMVLKFDSEDQIKDIILKSTVVENFNRV
jgi:hypothetical protein